MLLPLDFNSFNSLIALANAHTALDPRGGVIFGALLANAASSLPPSHNPLHLRRSLVHHLPRSKHAHPESLAWEKGMKRRF